jgi:hypothetical protein
MLLSFDDFRKTRRQSAIAESSVLEAIDHMFDQFKVDLSESARLNVVLTEHYDPLAHFVMESVLREDERQNKIFLEAYIDYCKKNFHNYIIEATSTGGAFDATALKKNLVNALNQFSKQVKVQIAKIINTSRTSADPSADSSLSPPPHSHSGDEGGSAGITPPGPSGMPKPATAAGLAGAGFKPAGSASTPPSAPAPGSEEEAPTSAAAPAPKKGGWPWRRFDTSKGNLLSRGLKGVANLVRTPLHWAANKIRSAWRGDSLPENVVNAMALLLEEAANEQLEKLMKDVDELTATLEKYISDQIDKYAAALGAMPKPTGPTGTPEVTPTGPAGAADAVKPEAPAEKALPPEKVAAATGVDPEAAKAGAAEGADPLAERVKFLKSILGGHRLNNSFLKALQAALTSVDSGAAIRARPMIKKLIAGIASDTPNDDWSRFGGTAKKWRSRAIPAMDILKQAVYNAMQKKNAGQPVDLSDEIIDLMRNEDKRAKVDMAGIFDKIKGKAAAATGTTPPAASTPPPAGSKPAAGSPLPKPPLPGTAPMDTRKPGQPPAPVSGTAPGAGASKIKGDANTDVTGSGTQTVNVNGKEVDPTTAVKAVVASVTNAKPGSPLEVFADMDENDDFFTKYLPPLAQRAVSLSLLKNDPLTPDKIVELVKAAVRNTKDKVPFPPEVLAFAGVDATPSSTPPAKRPGSEAPTAAPEAGKVAPEAKPEAGKPEAPKVAPEAKPEAGKPEAPKAGGMKMSEDPNAQKALEAYLAAKNPKAAGNAHYPVSIRLTAIRNAMAKDGLGSIEELEGMSPEQLALKIKGAEVGVEKPTEAPKETPKEAPKEAPKPEAKKGEEKKPEEKKEAPKPEEKKKDGEGDVKKK